MINIFKIVKNNNNEKNLVKNYTKKCIDKREDSI